MTTLGLAQRVFLNKENAPLTQWPAIDKLAAKGLIEYVDIALTSYLLRDTPYSEPVATFLCYLSMAVRAGHVCVDGTTPSFADLILRLSGENRSADIVSCAAEIDSFALLAAKGATVLPETLCTDLSDPSVIPTTPLCRKGNKIYFQRYWQAEKTLLHYLSAIQSAKPSQEIDFDTVLQCIDSLKQELLPEQAAAIKQAFQNNFFILGGGPGTGKTYTAGHLISIFWSALPPEQRAKCSIVLSAPTGKAAANLQASLKRAISKLHGFPNIQAQTLHSLLGIGKRAPELNADLILVDESSMIDLQLMATLFAAVKPGARLILLGDRHQLPPIGVGMPFGDLVAFLDTVAELKTCLRSDLKPIVQLASAIHGGDHQQALQLLDAGDGPISRLPCLPESNPRMAQRALLDYALPFFDKLSPDDSLKAMSNFCILSPLREGPFGVNTLNNAIAEKLSDAGTIPIVITKNDSRTGLSNGEIGILVKQSPHTVQKGDYALFRNKNSDGETVKIPALLLPAYEFAYCLSVHKSQGSEFDHVLLLMPQGAEIFGREILYTGVTRARKKLVLWGSNDTLRAAISRTAHRLSGL